MRIGVDVGGTNTDAALMDGRTVVDAVKSVTTEDTGLGIIEAVSKILDKTKIYPVYIYSQNIGPHYLRDIQILTEQPSDRPTHTQY